MRFKSEAQLAGRVKLQISGGARGTIDVPWFENMLLDRGIVSLLTGVNGISGWNYALSRLWVGTSSQPVQPTDVGCIAPLATVTVVSSRVFNGYEEDGGFGWSTAEFIFPVGAAAGNISELAVGESTNASTSNRSICRALVRDSNGNPTTISVLPDESLVVTWELRRWWIDQSPHIITYDTDGIPEQTSVSYVPTLLMGKGEDQLGSAGIGGFGGAMVSANTAEKTHSFSINQGNPAITNSAPPKNLGRANLFPTILNYATFDPPISKGADFKIDIVWQLTLTRRAS